MQIQTKEKSGNGVLLSDIEKSLLSSVMSRSEVAQKMNQSMRAINPQRMQEHMNMQMQLSMSTDMSQSAFFSSDNAEGLSATDFELDPPETTTLPAVIETSLRAIGVSEVKWTDVRTLPGAMHQGIVDLAWSIFKHFDMKQGASPKLVASLDDGDLLNSNMEVNAVLNFLEQNAVKGSPDNMTLSFDGTIDGYAPQVRLYYTEHQAYLAVLETEALCGRYIYAFERNNQGKINDEQKRLR